jgi:hypothetical protein
VLIAERYNSEGAFFVSRRIDYRGQESRAHQRPQDQSDFAIFRVPKSLNIRKPERSSKISRLLQFVDGYGDLYKSDLYKNCPSYTNRTWPLVFV